MMALVAGNDEAEREDANLLLAGDAPAEPGLVIERTEQADGGLPDGGKFLKKLREGA